MTFTRTQQIGAAVLIIVIAGLVFILRTKNPAPLGTVSTSTTAGYQIPTTTPQTSSTANGSVSTNAVGVQYTIISKGNWDTKPIPDINTPLTFTTNIPSNVQEQLRTGLKNTQAALISNPKNFSGWVNLGTIHKMAGDYRFAAEVWEYLAKVQPTNETPFYNLGDLYENYLVDYPKAETNYLKAIANMPTDTNVYRVLFVMYTNKYKQSTSAGEDILKFGIKTNPKSVDLEVVLAEYYKSKGRIAEAKAEYDVAIANAKAQGATALAAQIQTEKDSF